MKLQEWIDKKCKELIENKTFKDISIRHIDKCQISAYMTRQFFEIGREETIDMNIEVEEINRKELIGEVDALEIVFNAIKPRCRKPVRHTLFVKIA